MGYDPQLGGTVTSILGLILSRYDDQEHGEYNHNWQILNASVNGGILFSGVAPTSGQVLTAELVGSPPVLQASWQTPTGGGGGVSSFNGRVGAVIPLTGDYAAFYDAFGAAATAQSNAETFATSQGFITVAALSGYALLASPALSGTPTAPTAAPLTNNGQIATTAYVDAATGGSKFKTVRSTATSFTQGGVTGPIAMTFSSAFADNNYTVQVTVLGDEVAPGTPTVTQFPSVGVSYVAFQTIAGVGLNVWVSNNDSIPHTGHVHVAAWHD